jgi:hypothetical protein
LTIPKLISLLRASRKILAKIEIPGAANEFAFYELKGDEKTPIGVFLIS